MKVPKSEPLLFLAAAMACFSGCGKIDSASMEQASVGLVIEPSLVVLHAEDTEDRRRQVTCHLVNRGERDIHLLSVDASCACTLARPLEKSTLGPGESIPLLLTATLPRYGMKESVVKVFVEARSDAQVLRLMMHGPERTVPFLELIPNELRLTGQVPNEEASQEFQILTLERPEAKPWLTEIVDLKGEVSVELVAPPTVERRGEHEQRTYRFRLVAKLPATPGEAESFTLAVNGDPPVMCNGSPLAIHGTRVLVELLQVVPEQLVLRSKAFGEEPITRRILVVSADESLVVARPKDLPGWITIEKLGDEQSRRTRVFQLAFTNPGDGAERPFTLHFGAVKGASHVTVPLTITVLR